MRALVVFIAGCGRVGFDGYGYDLTGDGGTGDGTGDGTTSTACLAKWRDGPTLGMPIKFAELATAGTERDPWVSDDELRMYFTTTGNNSDLVMAKRATKTAAFEQPSPDAFAVINSNANEERPWLSPDEKTVTFVKVNGSTGLDLASATRNDNTVAFGSESSTAFASINTSGADMDPAISTDGLRLYYTMPPITNPSLAVATRTMTSQAFGGPMPFAELNHMTYGDSDPAPSRDELVILWASQRTGSSFDIYYATRTAIGAMFGATQMVPSINTMLSEEYDPFLSADGCTLYFASNRAGSIDLYFAQLQ